MTQAHPSIRALLAEEGGTDPVAAMRQRARRLVAEADAIGWPGPPFDMGDLASLRGLTVERSLTLRDDQDACVVAGRVLVNARQALTRQRYSIAHEIGHTLFPDFEDALRQAGRLWFRAGVESEFERLCQVAAAELLMPEAAFATNVAMHGRTVLGAFALRAEFDASLEAVVRRLVETSPQPLVGMFLRPRDLNTKQWIEPIALDGHQPRVPLGIEMASANDACGAITIRLGAAAARGGAADRAWKRVSLAKGQLVVEARAREDWTHAGLPGFWDGEALAVPRRSRTPRSVVCLLTRTAALGESPHPV